MPNLSICIPTYNRLKLLKDSLESLLPQAEYLQVEIFVSDNNSTDGTQKFLIDTSLQYNCLNYFFQKKNVGLEKNMLKAISMGCGSHILPIGDDEIIPNGTLSTIVDEISDLDDVIILNGWHTDFELRRLKNNLSYDLAGVCFTDPSKAFHNLWDKMSFGAFLARKDFFNIKCAKRFIGTSHAYSGVIWDSVANKFSKIGSCKIKCMKQPTILLRGGRKSWINDAAYIMLLEIPLWFHLIMQANVYEKVAKDVLKQYLNNNTKFVDLLFYRSSNQINKEIYFGMKSYYDKHQLIKVLIVLYIPKEIACVAINIFTYIKKLIKTIIGRK